MYRVVQFVTRYMPKTNFQSWIMKKLDSFVKLLWQIPLCGWILKKESKKMKLNETRRGKLEAEFLTAGKAYRAIFWPTSGFNEKTLQRGPSSRDQQCLVAKVSKEQNSTWKEFNGNISMTFWNRISSEKNLGEKVLL